MMSPQIALLVVAVTLMPTFACRDSTLLKATNSRNMALEDLSDIVPSEWRVTVLPKDSPGIPFGVVTFTKLSRRDALVKVRNIDRYNDGFQDTLALDAQGLGWATIPVDRDGYQAEIRDTRGQILVTQAVIGPMFTGDLIGTDRQLWYRVDYPELLVTRRTGPENYALCAHGDALVWWPARADGICYEEDNPIDHEDSRTLQSPGVAVFRIVDGKCWADWHFPVVDNLGRINAFSVPLGKQRTSTWAPSSNGYCYADEGSYAYRKAGGSTAR